MYQMNIVIFGAPGSGKGTQSERLIKEYGLHHISTGELLRDHIARGTEIGKVADSYISQGNLIPDELMLELLEHEIDTNSQKTSKGVIFDGFPRTVPQADALKALLARRGSGIHAVVGLEVADDELVDRLVKRGLESGRSDDNIDTIRKRLEVYHRQTSPLREYYVSEGKYCPIEGAGDVEKIFGDIKRAVDTLV